MAKFKGSRRAKGRGRGPGVRRRVATGRAPGGGPVWIYGTHAVLAALANPERQCRRLLLTAEARRGLESDIEALSPSGGAPPVENVDRRDIDAVLRREAVHQGVALEADPLAEVTLDALCHSLQGVGDAVVIALDQVTDPRNVGAIMRAASAFGAAAVIVTERHAPSATGALAKAAAGALERLPLVRVTNLARTLQSLKDAGFWCAGLDGGAAAAIDDAGLAGRTALVLGAEGAGLRRLTRERCDLLLRIPISAEAGSLNVATAAAVALYAVSRNR